MVDISLIKYGDDKKFRTKQLMYIVICSKGSKLSFHWTLCLEPFMSQKSRAQDGCELPRIEIRYNEKKWYWKCSHFIAASSVLQRITKYKVSCSHFCDIWRGISRNPVTHILLPSTSRLWRHAYFDWTAFPLSHSTAKLLTSQWYNRNRLMLRH